MSTMPPDPAPAYTRLTVLAPRTRVDVALPADVPLGELVPMVLELVGEPGPGHRPLPWRLTGATGGPLHPTATLDELGVLDGELLRIGPVAAPPPAPVFDDPVDALAAGAGRTVGPSTDAVRAAVALVLAALAAAVLAGVPAGPWAVVAALVGGAAAGAALTHAARRPDRAGTHPAALAAVPLAAGTGAAACAAAPGAAQLLAAVTAAGVAAAVGQAVLRVVSPVLVGIVVAAVPLGFAIVLHLRLGLSPAAPAAGLGAAALLAGPLLPRAALRLAGLPGPAIPTDAGELTDADRGPDAPPPAELARRSDLARGYLAGLVGGCAGVAAAAVGPAAAGGGWTGAALGAVVVAVLALRSRGFADAVPARTLLACAGAGGIALAVLAAAVSGGPGRLLVGCLALAGAVAAVAAGRGGRAVSPVARRAVDVLEGVLVASAVPLALGATGLFALVRGL